MSCLGIFVILINYKIIIINSALAAEAQNTQIVKKIIKDDANNKNYINCDCEKKFIKSYSVVWSGTVIATFVSGEDIGVRRYVKDAKYKQFYVDGLGTYRGELGKEVQVSGKLVGITCAYANTVFKECVAEVVADNIKVLN